MEGVRRFFISWCSSVLEAQPTETRSHFRQEMIKGVLNIRVLRDDIIEQYVDRDVFYRFSKPYLLRAQNKDNRTGYGSKWEKVGGKEKYMEGTLYGETTNYLLVGAYITTGYAYIKENRLPVNYKYYISKLKENNNSLKRNIVFYEGKLKEFTQNKTA